MEKVELGRYSYFNYPLMYTLSIALCLYIKLLFIVYTNLLRVYNLIVAVYIYRNLLYF